ncbi:hypothetical protein SARC_02045 [Sphaeroforma arctica JP610]|uniref:EF-hand domain-containing protein n=1 Tax=Sphaeroforma arctica JP610 TaxID=667725 RepID=A0A0L0G9S6_9EUKA|nr:hypothetical protein SARC_02045 [Sphaeroforma arctica JP610]KNC85782.1 hypothetical protein SARC_02045 [Sphaeroforma arctica JP610]|eukprot:XP_014159684.1 hypothetical protein SARC_02045 [Sphaeroforma arctica JP610]
MGGINELDLAKQGAKLLQIDPNQPTKELEWTITTLFRLVDGEKNGVIPAKKLEETFVRWGLSTEYASLLTESCDHDHDGLVKFSDFLNFFHHKEIQIKALFDEIDTCSNGKLTVPELRDALLRAGVQISSSDLNVFVKKIDKDQNGIITYDEWRDFLLLFPLDPDLNNVYHWFATVSMVDIGEGAVIPEGISAKSAWKYFLAGAVAGATSRTVTAPLDRLKVLLQVSAGPMQGGVLQGLRNIYNDGGWRAFWRGNGMNIIKITPESAVKFYTYETVKNLICDDPQKMKIYHRLVAGGSAGMVSQVAIYPMELIKTRLITQKVPLGIVGTFNTIVQKEGLRAFYRGLAPAVIGVVPYAAIDLALFESMKNKYMEMYNLKKPSALSLLCFGTMSSTVGATSVYPLNLVRTKLQADTKGRYSGALDCARQTFAESGVRGFYRGLSYNLLKVAPAVSVSYIVYDKAKSALAIT